MADLVSQANRLNDVEINNNGPVSSQTNRKIGSSINYLLNFLGIPNGTTTGGGGAGLNAFTPVQTVDYTYMFTGAEEGIAVPLFTFQGSGERPMRAYVDNNTYLEAEYYCDPIYKLDNQGAPSTGNQNEPHMNPYPRHLPILHILTQMQKMFFLSPAAPGHNAIVYCSGIEMGRVVSVVNGYNILYYRDILIAPAGTHTVSVLTDENLNQIGDPNQRTVRNYFKLATL